MKQKLNCILLIDDDEPTTFLSSVFIQEADCTENIQIADSAQKALNYLNGSDGLVCGDNNYIHPELIFLDINMPAMNGWEFLKEYNDLEDEQKGNIVIIMLTTSLNPDDKAKAEETPHIAGFENKPLTDEKLAGLLLKYFPDNN